MKLIESAWTLARKLLTSHRCVCTDSAHSLLTQTQTMLCPVCICVVLLCFVASSRQQQCDQPLINNVADFVMSQLLTQYPTTIKLANLSSSFLYNTGRVEANYGTLASLSTIRRKGDLELTFLNNSVNIILPISFRYLTVTYDEYKLKVAGLSTSGSLQTTVMDNLIKIYATMGEKSLCFVTINKIIFLKLSDFEVRLRSSCDVCSKVTSSVTSSALNFFKSRIKSLVEAKLNETLYKVMKPNNTIICNKQNLDLNLYNNDNL